MTGENNWRRARRDDLPEISAFLSPREYRACSLSSRLSRYGQLRLPGRSEGSLWIFSPPGDNPKGGTCTIRGLLLLCSHGLLLPLFHETEGPERSDLAALYRRLGDISARIYCILGRREEVKLCEDALGRALEGDRSFLLMTRKHRPAPFPPPEGYTIRRIRETDGDTYFPLERAYQLEEVVLSRERYHETAGRIHFRKQCKSQIILAMDFHGEGVAKAGTNAIGIRYCQIGGVYTKPEHRSRGLAASLMESLLSRIFARGQYASLFVRNDNLAALGLYRKLHFEVRCEYRIAYPKPGT